MWDSDPSEIIPKDQKVATEARTKRQTRVKKPVVIIDDSSDDDDEARSSKTVTPKKRKAAAKTTSKSTKKFKQEVTVDASIDEYDGPGSSKAVTPKKRKAAAKATAPKANKRVKKDDASNADDDFDLKSNELYQTSSDFTLLSELCDIPQHIALNIIKLIKEDNTLPFIARYRKTLIDNMMPDKLQEVFDQFENICQLRKRAKTILESLKKSKKLSPSLMNSIIFAKSVAELELLYTPHKSKTGTLAERARSLGLEPAALQLMENDSISIQSLIDPSNKDLANAEKVEEHIVHIIADVIYKDTRVLEFLRKLRTQAVISLQCTEAKTTKKKSDENAEISEDAKEKYKLYLNFKNRIEFIKSHQTLAINRGEKAKVLSVKVVIPDWYGRQLENFCRGIWRGSLVPKAVNDACTRLIIPWLSRQVRSDLTTQAENESILVFAENLERFLLTEPVKNRNILAIDPGFKAGCKVAIVRSDGSVADVFVMHPYFKSSNDQQAKRLDRAVFENRCEVIALGNGTACRETESWLKSHYITNNKVPLIIIPEQGASIYSCSPDAQKEYPNMDPNLISAISLAKRVLDPLAELVKVEPKHLGVGLYQHDMPPKKLSEALDNVVIRCVSMVGIDVNTASKALLRRVAGLSDSRAAAIIKHREENCGIKSREEILKISGIGPKTFKQCAGFMKIQNGTEPLDNTIIHPESYVIAKKIAKKYGFNVKNLGEETFLKGFSNVTNIEVAQLSTEFKTDAETIQLIVNAFNQLPHADDLKLNKPIYSCTVGSASQLVIGATVNGIVRNVTPFGCFVDCGVGRDGLIHSSKMNGNRWPKLGERVSVKISGIPNPQRIELLLIAIL